MMLSPLCLDCELHHLNPCCALCLGLECDSGCRLSCRATIVPHFSALRVLRHCATVVALAEAVDLARVPVCVECHMCTLLVQITATVLCQIYCKHRANLDLLVLKYYIVVDIVTSRPTTSVDCILQYSFVMHHYGSF